MSISFHSEPTHWSLCIVFLDICVGIQRYVYVILFIINIIASGCHVVSISVKLGLNKSYSMWYILVNNV